MNDNIKSFNRNELISGKTTSELRREFFDFYACLPDFITNHAEDRRIGRGQGRRLLIQIKDREYFLHITEHHFRPF